MRLFCVSTALVGGSKTALVSQQGPRDPPRRPLCVSIGVVGGCLGDGDRVLSSAGLRRSVTIQPQVTENSAVQGNALFLSYNSAEREVVLQISKLLEARGIPSFLDQDQQAGLPWPEALEQALTGAKAVAVFLGGAGFGVWQRRELWFALDRQAHAKKVGASFPVIPVLLPGADPTGGFLFLNTWIDLRRDPTDPEGLGRLARAVAGAAPAEAEAALSSFCPYRGLRSFREEDAAFFCGREAFSDRLLEAVLHSPFVAVLGSSGSGKSSVVHAGLLPRLRRQRPPALSWDAVSFTPGERPYHRLAGVLLPLLEPEMTEVQRLREAAGLGDDLASGRVRLEDAVRRALEKSGGTGRLLVVADQFEELFTLTEEATRKPFVQSLLTITEKVPVTLVLALRADFYDRALTLDRGLSDLLEKSLVNLGPMLREELSRAIRGPAERVGLELDSGLVDRILGDVGEEPGNLPLLEFALTELWARRSGRRLTNAAYTEIGGVARAIAQRAEAELERLPEEQRLAARRVFTSLVRVARAEEGSRDTRRRARLADFDAVALQVVDRLAGPETRLLVTERDEKGENVVAVVHEALIQSWERLRLWLDEDREFLLWRERLRIYLAENKKSGTLLSGAPLAEAERWLGEQPEHLSSEEIGLIQESLEARNQAVKAETRRRLRSTRTAFAIAGIVAVLCAVAGWLGFQSWRQAREARVASILTIQEAIDDPALLALLAKELDKQSTARLRSSLDAVRFAHRAAVEALPVTIIRADSRPLKKAVFSPNGERVLTVSSAGKVQLWSSNGFGKPATLGSEADRCDAAFSLDGSRLVTSCGKAGIQVWNPDGFGRPVTVRRFEELGGSIISPEASRVILFSMDGNPRIVRTDGSGEPIVLRTTPGDSILFSADGAAVLAIHNASAVEVWKGEDSGEPTVISENDDVVFDSAFSPDASHVMVVVADQVQVRRSDGSGEPVVLRSKADSFPVVGSFSPDGMRLVVGFSDGIVQICKSDGSGEPIVFRGHADGVRSARFSFDGTRIITTSSDHTARVWRSDGSGEPIVLRDESLLRDANFSRDGSRIVTVATDGSARIWRFPGSEPSLAFAHARQISGAVLSPNGAKLAILLRDGIAQLYSVGKAEPPVTIHGHEGEIINAVFSRDGSRIAVAFADNTAQIWKADGSGTPILLSGHQRPITSVAFSDDGTRVITGSKDYAAMVWSTSGSSRPIVLQGNFLSVNRVAFSPDGSRILIATQRGAEIWRADGSGKPVLLPRSPDSIYDAAFSPDGAHVALSGGDAVRIWRADGSGNPTVLGGNQDISVAFSPDGSRVVSASRDGTVRVWNADGSGQPLVLVGHDGPVADAVFSSDGSRVITVTTDGKVRIWRVTWESLLKCLKESTHACLTPGQREQYLGESASEARAAYETCQQEL